MKNMAIVITLLSSVLVACSRNDHDHVSGDEATLTAVIGGVAKNLSVELKAHQNNERTISLVGYTPGVQQGKAYDALQIAIFNAPEKIAAQTYTMDAGPHAILVTYTLVKPNGDQENFAASPASASPYDAFSIKITSINDKRVKGSFSGKVVKAGGTDVLTITDGIFSAAIH